MLNYIKIVENSPEWEEMYEHESGLAKLYSQDIEAYCDGKDDFVKSMEREALKWYKEG